MITTNYLLERKGFAFSVDISIDRDNDIKKVESVTKEVVHQTIAQTKGGIIADEPAVRFVKFGENSIELKASMQVKEFHQQSEATHLFILNIQERYAKENIRFAFSFRSLLAEQKKLA
jgi:small-conductance mechanosensitive channel